jgi:hypothetical protein
MMLASWFGMSVTSRSLFLGIWMTCSLPVAFAIEYRTGDEVTVDGVASEVWFAAGGKVSADLTSRDDVFLGGGEVRGTVKTDSHLFVGGGQLTTSSSSARLAVLGAGDLEVTQSKFHDAILGAGQAHLIQTEVTDDLVLGGGDVTVDARSRVGGSTTAAGGTVRLQGSFGNDVWAAGETVILSGQFNGNVRVEAKDFTLTDTAKIQGNLIYRAQEASLSPAATVLGQKTMLEPEDSWAWEKKTFSILGILGGLLFMLGVMLVPGLTAWLFPKSVDQARDMIRTQGWETLGKGALSLLVIPFVFVGLLLTVAGVPLALLSIPVLLLLSVFAWSSVSYTVGGLLRVRFRFRLRSGYEHFLTALLGGVLLALATSIPFFGVLVWLAAFLLGTGATLSVLQKSWSARRRG